MSSRLKRQLHESNLVIAGIVIGGVIIGFYLFLSTTLYDLYTGSPQAKLNVLNIAINSFSVLASSGLTLMLIYLYHKMASISERQIELEEAQHKPQVFIREYEIRDDHVFVRFANGGMGIAKDFGIRFDARVISDDSSINGRDIEEIFNYNSHGFEIGPIPNPLIQAEEEGVEDSNEEMKEKLSRHVGGAEVLRPQEEGWYQSTFPIIWAITEKETSISGDFRSIPQIIDRIRGVNTNIEELSVQLSLIYRDINNNIDLRPIATSTVDINEKQTLEELLQNDLIQREEGQRWIAKSSRIHFNNDEIIEKIDIKDFVTQK